MKITSNFLVFISVALVVILKTASTGKIIVNVLFNRLFVNEFLLETVALTDSSASDENDASLREKKNTDILTAQHAIPTPLRRHHLKFGVLGKRHSLGYATKRNEGQYERERKNRFE